MRRLPLLVVLLLLIIVLLFVLGYMGWTLSEWRGIEM